MTEIQRYDLNIVECYGDDAWLDQEQRDDGDWVKYDDHATELATLRAEVERLREKLGVIASDDWNNADWVRDFAKEALK